MKKLFAAPIKLIKKYPKTDLLILALGLAVFLTITLINAPRASIWFDEAFSAYIVQFSFWDIAQYTAADVHPPFYYWLLKVWTSLFGTTELALRSLSILFGAATTVVTFFLTRKLFGRRVALTTLLFLVISPMLIRYSDEARMYTLAALIVMSATYVLVKAEETKKKSLWVWYGVLVSLGMWTHYFTALAWLAHWAWRGFKVWRKGDTLKQFWKKFFTKTWVVTYAIAIGLFIPWLPFMAYQLVVVQSAGFWIGPVSASTPSHYLSSYFYYLEGNQAQGWWALVIIALAALVIILLPKVYRSLKRDEKRSFMLIAALAWVPPALLIFASLPPLQSSFVDRYLVPSVVALSVFLAIVLVAGTKNWKPFWRSVPVLAIVAMMIFGITNVYYYGNYNKNTSMHILSRQVIDEIHKAAPDGAIIIADSPWTFYEAIPYATDKYPVYFTNQNIEYKFGSLKMLNDNDQHKIKDIDAFQKENPVVWFVGTNESGDISAYGNGWEKLETVSVKDEITGKTLFKATEYKFSAE